MSGSVDVERPRGSSTGVVDAGAGLDGVDRTAASDRQRNVSQVPYLPGLDGIRALAVVAVMVYHANSDWLAGGFMGVEVFFVISGYLITLLIIAEYERTGEFDLKQFWIRRARRLLPALFTMMLLLSVWVALFERDALGKLRGDVIAGVFYGSNWYQIWIGAGYSAGNDFAPLRHLWSLAVEEQYYVLWPLAMLALVKVGTRSIARIAGWLFLAAVAITVLTAVLDYTAPQQTPEITPEGYWFVGDRPISKPDALYLSTITRAGGLLLGGAFAMIWRPQAVMRSPLRHRGRMFDVVGLVGLAVIALLCVVLSFQPAEGVHPFLFKGGFFVIGVASLAIVAAVTHGGSAMGGALSNPVLLWIGTRSYGLYLYHWPIYQIIRNIAANKLAFHEFVLAMVATALITEASYRWIETPIRTGAWRDAFRSRRRSDRLAVGGPLAMRTAPSAPGGRTGVIAGAFVGTALAVFAGASLATADLIQNEVAESLDEGEAATCDVLTEDCSDAATSDAADPLTGDDVAVDPAPGSDDAADDSAITDDADVDGPTAEGELTNPADTVTVTTEPPVTTLPPAPERLAIGDSVMLGAAEELQELGFVVDAAESRSFGNGLDVVRALADQGRLPEILVVHLGTNGPIDDDELAEMMTAAATVPQVVLVENDVDREWEAGNNAALSQAAVANPNTQVLFWSGLSGQCSGDCIYNDGIHLKSTGARYYSRLIAGVLGLDVPTSLLEG